MQEVSCPFGLFIVTLSGKLWKLVGQCPGPRIGLPLVEQQPLVPRSKSKHLTWGRVSYREFHREHPANLTPASLAERLSAPTLESLEPSLPMAMSPMPVAVHTYQYVPPPVILNLFSLATLYEKEVIKTSPSIRVPFTPVAAIEMNCNPIKKLVLASNYCVARLVKLTVPQDPRPRFWTWRKKYYFKESS